MDRMNVRSDTGWMALVPEWVIRHPALGSSAKLVYVALALYADREGQAHPSVARLCADTGLTRRPVQGALAELEAVGAVDRESRFQDGRQTSNVYVVRRVAAQGGAASDAGGGAASSAQEQTQLEQIETLAPPRAARPRRDAPPKPPDPLFEALAEACGIDWINGIPRTARAALNAAVKDLREIGAEPHDVPDRANRLVQRWGHDKLTPHSLAKHWPTLTPTRPAPAGHPNGCICETCMGPVGGGL